MLYNIKTEKGRCQRLKSGNNLKTGIPKWNGKYCSQQKFVCQLNKKKTVKLPYKSDVKQASYSCIQIRRLCHKSLVYEISNIPILDVRIKVLSIVFK